MNDFWKAVFVIVFFIGLAAIIVGVLIGIWGTSNIGWKITLTGLIPFIIAAIIIRAIED